MLNYFLFFFSQSIKIKFMHIIFNRYSKFSEKQSITLRRSSTHSFKILNGKISLTVEFYPSYPIKIGLLINQTSNKNIILWKNIIDCGIF